MVVSGSEGVSSRISSRLPSDHLVLCMSGIQKWRFSLYHFISVYHPNDRRCVCEFGMHSECACLYQLHSTCFFSLLIAIQSHRSVCTKPTHKPCSTCHTALIHRASNLVRSSTNYAHRTSRLCRFCCFANAVCRLHRRCIRNGSCPTLPLSNSFH